jgi:UDP-N-acetylmuramoyl-L-alanyl-D-glutamate--2,6-diaminopimelate ligase
VNAGLYAPLVPVAQTLAGLGVPVTRITSDSRTLRPGDAFAAYPGEARDGREFIPHALERGAGSVLWERAGFTWRPQWRAPNVAVTDLKQELGWIADAVCAHPSERLWMVGVTGTNGKTSCSHWIAQALNALGRRTAVAGTLGNGFPGAIEPAPNTTPDAAALHEMLRTWRDAGAAGVAMEVSSHGLVQGRVNGVKFDVALFTNLTRDHLDYHGTMQAYGDAKARLFAWPSLKTAVINVDDPFGAELIERCGRLGVAVLAYGQTGGDVRATRIAVGVDGVSASVETPMGRAELKSGVVGAFNVSNLLGCLSVLLASGVPLDAAVAQLSKLQPVAGRMQRTGGGDKPLVVVDYAHTPDALEKVLSALRPVARSRNGRLVAVFGCGGDRDPGKRPQMGAIAARLADAVVVTSDNPRSEVPAAIVDAVVAGIPGSASDVAAIVSRDEAIAHAIARAGRDDVVLIAGKGHESYQEIAGVRHPFLDLEHANAALAEWVQR